MNYKAISAVLTVLLSVICVGYYLLSVEVQSLRSNGVIVAGALQNSNILSGKTPTDEEARAIDFLLQYE
jgi:hypothetical protein